MFKVINELIEPVAKHGEGVLYDESVHRKYMTSIKQSNNTQILTLINNQNILRLSF